MNTHYKLPVFASLISLLALVGCASAPVDESTTGVMAPDTMELDAAVKIGKDVLVSTIADPENVDVASSADLGASRIFYFDVDQALLNPEAYQALTAYAEILKAAPRMVRLEGHADERGTREYNIALSERRANAVKEFLVMQGVPAHLIEVISYGEERAAVYGSNESAWSANRRVEIK
jgi:peptidoglycan-associated lipoprotein